ncbi:MAG: formyltransferase family protein [Planctomycetota bacterium]|nr:formyltransferase family protein [Planctomycetota bacterium]MDW8373619.1 formyltransferase family protein [Planctomycetota bacterium]
MSAPRLGLLLLGDKGLACLAGALASALPPSFVVVGEDPGQDDRRHELRARAAAAGLPVYERTAPWPPATHLIAAGWRWLLPLSGPTVLVLHDSLLPKLRGWNPLVTALIEGETQLGVTALRAVARPDAGPIIAQRSLAIAYPIRIAEAIARLAPLYGELTQLLAARIAAGDALVGSPQDEAAATYSLWRDEADYDIDWSWEAARIRRFIDATGPPYRGAAALCDGRPVRILAAQEQADLAIVNRTPGKVLAVEDGQPLVVCGRGLLRLVDWRDAESGEPLRLPPGRLRLRFTARTPR